MQKLALSLVVYIFICWTCLCAEENALNEKLFRMAEGEISRLLTEKDQVAARNISLRIATYLVFLADGRAMDKRFENLFLRTQIASRENGHAKVDMLVSPSVFKQKAFKKWLEVNLSGGGIAYREIPLMDLVADIYETMNHSKYQPELFVPVRYDDFSTSIPYFMKLENTNIKADMQKQ